MTRKPEPAPDPAAAEELTFEQALDRLEQIVKELEEGERGLEEAIRLYEEGRRLVRLSTAKLDEAQSRIERLVRTEEGWETPGLSVGSEGDEDVNESEDTSADAPSEDDLPF